MDTAARQIGPDTDDPAKEPFLLVTIHPTCNPLKWEAGCQLVAFIRHYASFFFDETIPSSLPDDISRKEVEDAIDYILLELIENAMKFNTSGDIEVGIEIHRNELCFIVGNQVETGDVARIRNIFQELDSGDPNELLVRRIEENAADPDSVESGVGFLTIMSNYGAKLGWHFSTDVHPDRVRLTIMTHYPIDQSEL